MEPPKIWETTESGGCKQGPSFATVTAEVSDQDGDLASVKMIWTILTGGEGEGSVAMAYDSGTNTATGQLSFGPETVDPRTQPALVNIVIVAVDGAGNQASTEKNPAHLDLLNCP